MAYMSAVQVAAPITRVAFPMLFASVGVEIPATGDDATDIGAAAVLVGQREAAWAIAGAVIERRRLMAKKSIAEARDKAAIELALAQFRETA